MAPSHEQWAGLLSISRHGIQEYEAFAPIAAMVEKFTKLDAAERIDDDATVRCDGEEE
ncbi:MAG: hypothetical protein R3B09_09015 [Nannocystaceae bacterium]